MAGNGPAPKPDGQRRRRNAPAAGAEKAVTRDDALRGPEPREGWSDEVVEWFTVWRRSAQAALFEETDWMRLVMMAPLVDKAFKGSIAAMVEVRLTESLLGATVTDRLKARIRVEHDDAEDAPARLASVSDFEAEIAARMKRK